MAVESEREWLTCTDPSSLVSGTSLGFQDCQRVRVFAVRWMEQLRPQLRDEIDQETLTIYANSVRNGDAIPAWREPQVTDEIRCGSVTTIEQCFHMLRLHVPALAAVEAVTGLATGTPSGDEMLRQFCDEFRDVAGNPFRPVVFDPAWRTETAVGLAAGIDEAGAYERLPILADALQEAGCEDEQVLAHARGPGPHVRGCWLLDMVLGRW